MDMVDIKAKLPSESCEAPTSRDATVLTYPAARCLLWPDWRETAGP